MKTLDKEELKILRKKYGYTIGQLINASLNLVKYCKTKNNNYNNKEEWEY